MTIWIWSPSLGFVLFDDAFLLFSLLAMKRENFGSQTTEHSYLLSSTQILLVRQTLFLHRNGLNGVFLEARSSSCLWWLPGCHRWTPEGGLTTVCLNSRRQRGRMLWRKVFPHSVSSVSPNKSGRTDVDHSKSLCTNIWKPSIHLKDYKVHLAETVVWGNGIWLEQNYLFHQQTSIRTKCAL